KNALAALDAGHAPTVPYQRPPRPEGEERRDRPPRPERAPRPEGEPKEGASQARPPREPRALQPEGEARPPREPRAEGESRPPRELRPEGETGPEGERRRSRGGRNRKRGPKPEGSATGTAGETPAAPDAPTASAE
ncbi:MAG: hypothetical protein M3Y12_10020, partial [Bacteroidota bacterium]|nr:hypothetical protein [Bacteroidota bacterium]